MTPDLIRETPADGVLLLRLNRPEKRNALSTPLLVAIADAVDGAGGGSDIRVIVISGNETVFAAGADLDELAMSTSADQIETPRFQAWARIEACAKPLIAAVEGWCLGAGLELVLRADLVIAGIGARFGQPETNLGVMPGAGGTSILPRLVGRSLAMEMVLTGEPITADRACAAGLIARVVPDTTALQEAIDLAAKLASRAPLALRTAKASILKAENLALDDHLLAERIAFVGLLSGQEKAEGIAAFREKRRPRWE